MLVPRGREAAPWCLPHSWVDDNSVPFLKSAAEAKSCSLTHVLLTGLRRAALNLWQVGICIS